MSPAFDALDRLQTTATCFRAVESLMLPSVDGHLIDREALAMLIGFLNAEHNKALAALSALTL